MTFSTRLRLFGLTLSAAILLSTATQAAEIHVMISGGMTAAFKSLVPEFERRSGHKVDIAYGPSMGTTANAIPVRDRKSVV